MNKTLKNYLIGLAIFTSLALIIVTFWRYSASRPTTYCTEWVKATSITPTNSDNGKHADEQYVVTYEDGSISGEEQGAIPYARCTNKVEVHHSEANPDWKTVHYSGYTDWEQ